MDAVDRQKGLLTEAKCQELISEASLATRDKSSGNTIKYETACVLNHGEQKLTSKSKKIHRIELHFLLGKDTLEVSGRNACGRSAQ